MQFYCRLWAWPRTKPELQMGSGRERESAAAAARSAAVPRARRRARRRAPRHRAPAARPRHCAAAPRPPRTHAPAAAVPFRWSSVSERAVALVCRNAQASAHQDLTAKTGGHRVHLSARFGILIA